MPYGILAADQIQSSVTGVSLGAGNATRFKNRFINGDMRIDQRSNGTSITPLTTGSWYGADRWQYYLSQSSKFTSQQSTTAPTGFNNSVLITSSSAYAVLSADFFCLRQIIEGFNFADCYWGTVNAKTVTLSFWVQSSLTGTFGGAFANSDNSRCYPFSYSIPVANTWTQISITIAGDTTGTWLTNNGRGVTVYFGLGVGSTVSGTAGSWSGTTYYSATGATSVVGTNGATFYITGVQLEVGSFATGFEYRDYGTELAMCQRYFETSYTAGVSPGNVTSVGYVISAAQPSGITGTIPNNQAFAVMKRTTPTMTAYSPVTGTAGRAYLNDPAGDTTTTAFWQTSAKGFAWYTSSNIINPGGAMYAQWTASAEL